MRTTMLAGLAIVGLTASFGSAHATAPASPSARAAASAPTFGVVVAGDSYSAGNGAGSYQAPSHCYRSPLNYAGRFVTAIDKAPYVHVIRMDGLDDVAQVAVATKNPAGELTGIGFTAAQATYLLAEHT